MNLSTSGDALLALLLPLFTNALLPPPPNNLLFNEFFCFFINLDGSSISFTFVVAPISSGIGSPVAPPVLVTEPVGIVVVMYGFTISLTTILGWLKKRIGCVFTPALLM